MEVKESGLGLGTQIDRNRRLLETITVENGYGNCVVEAVSKVKYLTGHPGSPVFESKRASTRQLLDISPHSPGCAVSARHSLSSWPKCTTWILVKLA